MADLNTTEIIDEVQSLRDINSKRATVSLVGLVLVFFLSISFFLFSDYLSPQPTQNTDKDIYLYEQELKKQLSDLTSKYGEAKSDISLHEKALPTAGSASNLSEDEQNKYKNMASLEVLKERASNLVTEKESILRELNVIQEGRLSSLKATNESKTIETIIATSITRIGAVLLSVFMMQILLGFFRYYTRLSNHYATKVVALKAVGSANAEGVASVVNSMQPESIAFGKEPQMPFEKVFELLKSVK